MQSRNLGFKNLLIANAWHKSICEPGEILSLCRGKDMADVASLYSYKNKLLPLAGTYFCFRNNIDSKWLGGCCCLVTKSYLTLCAPMGCSTPGFPVLHCLLELAQSHDHWVDDAIQPSYPLSPPSPALSRSQPQVLSMNWLFASGEQSIRASVSAPALPMGIQGWFPLGLAGLISMWILHIH